MFVEYNPNPLAKRVGDCTVRAIAKATGLTWDGAFAKLSAYGFQLADMPSSNLVWGAYLQEKGFSRHLVQDTEYSVRRFAEEHPSGAFVLALSGHVVTVVDGNYFDTWDSGDEVPVYYWQKE